MANRASRNELHQKLSALIDATAVFPPRDEESGFNLFDILVVKSFGSKLDMLVPTRANLVNVVNVQEKDKLKDMCFTRKPSKENKYFSTRDSWSASISSVVNAIGVSSGFGVSLGGRKITDLILVGEAKSYLDGDLSTDIEALVYKYFSQLVSTTALKNYVSKKFIFGVVTKAVNAELHAETTGEGHGWAGAKANTSEIRADMRGDVQTARRMQLCSRGVVGINMLCFVVECDAESREFRLSAPIPILRADERGFRNARMFISGGPVDRVIMMMRGSKKHLYIGTHITSPNDPSLDAASRAAYERVSKYMDRPAFLGSNGEDDSSEEDFVELMDDFGGVDGEALWNSNSVTDGARQGNGKQILVVTDLEGLDDASNDAALRWLPPASLPESVIVHTKWLGGDGDASASGDA